MQSGGESPTRFVQAALTFSSCTAKNEDVFKGHDPVFWTPEAVPSFDTDLQVKLAVICEGVDELACLRIDGLQKSTRRDQDATILAVFALPVVCTAHSGNTRKA